MTPSNLPHLLSSGELDELDRLMSRATPGWRANSVNIYSVVSNQSHPVWTLSEARHREISSRDGVFIGEDRELLLAMYDTLPRLLATARAHTANPPTGEKKLSTAIEHLEQFAKLDDEDRRTETDPLDKSFYEGRANGLRIAINYIKCAAPSPTGGLDREEVARIIHPQAWEKSRTGAWRYRDAHEEQTKALAKADQIIAKASEGGAKSLESRAQPNDLVWLESLRDANGDGYEVFNGQTRGTRIDRILSALKASDSQALADARGEASADRAQIAFLTHEVERLTKLVGEQAELFLEHQPYKAASESLVAEVERLRVAMDKAGGLGYCYGSNRSEAGACTQACFYCMGEADKHPARAALTSPTGGG